MASALLAVYADGRVCISILHNPGDDPHGYEKAAERWSPVHTVHPCPHAEPATSVRLYSRPEEIVCNGYVCRRKVV